MPAPQTYRVVDDHGNASEIDEGHLASALSQGFKIENAGEQADRLSHDVKEETYGGIGGTVKAFGANALSGATLGLSDAAIAGLGGGDELSALREIHPYAAGAGQIAGALAPALLGDEAGLLNLTPGGMTSRIGARIAESGGGRVAGIVKAGAFEGAAQNAGAYVSDVALGDRDISAEGFMGAMGKGALYGGVASGALSVASHGLIAARKLFPVEDLTPAGVARARLGAKQAVNDSVETSGGLERVGQDAVVKTDRETQQFIQDLEQERAAALGRAAETRTAQEAAVAPPAPGDPIAAPGEPITAPGESVPPATPETPAPPAAPAPKTARELMGSWREKYPQGAVELDAATAAARRQRMAEWARDFEAKTPEDETIKAYFGEPRDPASTTDRIGMPDAPKAVQQVARQAAADASHQAYLDATAQGANVSTTGPELMARATYAGRKAAAQAMDDVYAAYAAGKPIVDIRAAATSKLTSHLHELAEARADMIKSLAGHDDLTAQLTAMAASKEPLSLGQRILQGAERPVNPDEAVANALGKSKDVNEDIASIAPKITRYEAAKANLTEALGDKASQQAREHAAAFRAAQEQAANSNAKIGAQAVEHVDAAARGVPVEALPGGRARLGGLAEKAGNAGAVYEMMRGVGIPLPDPHDIPVIGPILSMYLKAKILGKALGKHSGSIAATAEGTIAAKAALTRNRINSAVGKMLDNSSERVAVHAADLAGGASALGHKLFDTGKGAAKPYKSDPDDGDIGKLYTDRMSELTAAMQPGAIDREVRARVNAGDPTIVAAIVKAETNKLTWLYNQAPKQDAPAVPGQPPQLPSQAELIKFGQTLAASHDPSAIFERVANGGVARPHEVLCVQNCYSQLYAEAQRHLVEEISTADKPMSYSKRIAVSQLLGVPMDSTWKPSRVAYLQSTSHAAVASNSPSAPPPNPTLTSSITMGDRTLTRLDR